MVASGKIAKIEHNAVHTIRWRVLTKVVMTVQNDMSDVVQMIFRKAVLGGSYSCLLNIKSQNLSRAAHEAA